MTGTNFYTQSSLNPNVWIKFATTDGLVDDCELRGTTTLPTDVDMFSQGCTLKIKSTGEQFINLAADKLAPVWSSNILSVTRHVTSAEIKQLFSNPIELVPAPGVGKYIVGLNVFRKFNYVAPQFVQPGNTNIGVAGNNFFQFGQFIIGTASTVLETLVNSTCTLTENEALMLFNTTADPSVGNSDFDLIVNYQIKSISI